MTENKDIRKDLEILLKWLKNLNKEEIYFFQETILNVIKLLKDPKFREKIASLRIGYKIPNEQLYAYDYTEFEWKKDADGGYSKRTAPLSLFDKPIEAFCREFSLSAYRYGEFVINYLYFANVVPPKPEVMYGDIPMKDEFKYKARVEINMGGGSFPQVGYIRFFQNTSKNKLKKFVDANWKAIQGIQKHLDPYPHTRTRNLLVFKRDIQIYLLHCLGNKSPEIGRVIDEDFVPQDKDISDEELNLFVLDDANIRKVVANVKREISKSSDVMTKETI